MRVIHIMKAVGVAGAERHLLLLAAGLRARGIDVQILLLVEPDKPLDDFGAAAAAQGIPLQRLVIRHDLDPTILPALWRHLRRLKPDVAHTHLLHADLYGIPAAKLAGVPAIVSSRHNDNRFRRGRVFSAVNRILWQMCDAGIGISDAIRRFCIEVEGASPAKMHTIYYGLDAEALPDRTRQASQRTRQASSLQVVPSDTSIRRELGIADDAPAAGMVCRLIEQKGVTYALQAFARVADQFPAARLVIAGDGILRGQLEAEADSLGISGRVHWLGWRPDSAAVLASLDLLLMPSLWEGFGLVLLEAMAAHLPIIGSRVSAIPEVVVDGETGLLVPPADVSALAAALSRLLEDEALRRTMGERGAARLAAHFSTAVMIDATIGLYQSLLAFKQVQK